MRIINGKLVISASDLTKFVRCAHATTLDLGRARKTFVPLVPPHASRATALIVRKGSEYEAGYLEEIKAGGRSLVEIDTSDRSEAGLHESVQETIAAMRNGADTIYQAAFFDGESHGYADLLEKVTGTDSRFGDWSYEVVDTKLARSSKPHFVIQLAFYSEQLRKLQGPAPDKMHIVLGNGEKHSFRFGDFKAYYHYIHGRLLSRLTSNPSTASYPVEFCPMCEWHGHCSADLEQRDHLTLVASIRRSQLRRIEADGLTTFTLLATAAADRRIPKLAADSFARLQNQARLQLTQRADGLHRYELLEPEEATGFEKLPRCSRGDIFFDVEADPYASGGLTFLFGLAWEEGGEEKYSPFWAHTTSEEKGAVEATIDFIMTMRERFPDMHVYHYSALDRVTLARLAADHATREAEMDELLREERFIDLFAVVRQAVRISQPSYSLKKVEAFYFRREEKRVFEEGGPILAYEEWLATDDPDLLVSIENYNREDCVSTLQLLKWLMQLRAEAEVQFGKTISWKETPDPRDRKQENIDADLEEDALSAALISGLSVPTAETSEEDRGRWLLARLVHYHRREDRPGWWSYFNHRDMSPEELLDDNEAISGLVLDESIAPWKVDQSLVYTFRFPPQDFKITPSKDAIDPATEKGVIVQSIDSLAGTLRIKRGLRAAGPFPKALILGRPIDNRIIRKAVRRVARHALEHGFDRSRYAAAWDILMRRAPRLRGIPEGFPLHDQHVDTERVTELVVSLDESSLFIQGPPGAGKTWTGARVIVELLKQGNRVGISSNSHKAIHNLLAGLERHAQEIGFRFAGLKKSGDNEESVYESPLPDPMITNDSDISSFANPDVKLIAGTAWLFCVEALDSSLDYLFIDEAGQLSIANTVAIATSARNIVLLGDPLQLAQVSQASHPDQSGRSILEHLLGSDATIPASRGVFLDRTWRMHPDVCRFISEVVYDGRLESHPDCARQNISPRLGMIKQQKAAEPHEMESTPLLTLSGTGLRYIAVEHESNSRSSEEEAARIVEEIRTLLAGASVTGRDAVTLPLAQGDIMVVAPYNAQVRLVREVLNAAGMPAVAVGTVDKFQGREAPVLFFTMATSSGDDLPRDIDFLFSRNRLNVAISRAQCLAILVASPRLLDVDCKTVEQMGLVNALCWFVETAKRV